VSSFIWTVLRVSPYFFHLVPKRRHFSEKNQDFLIEFTSDLLWFVPQIVGQPKPSYRQKSEFEYENFRSLEDSTQDGFLQTLRVFCVLESHRILFIRVTKSEPYLIFSPSYPCIPVSQQWHVATHVLSLSSCERGHTLIVIIIPLSRTIETYSLRPVYQ
jgi:hypothetical protein